MNLLEMICKEIGVEIGEIWAGSDGHWYRISSDGDIDIPSKIDDGEPNILWKDIIMGKLKLRWIPVEGEKYYVPDPTYRNGKTFGYENITYVGSKYDKWAIDKNMVYKTKEEAIAAANKMLESLKEGQ